MTGQAGAKRTPLRSALAERCLDYIADHGGRRGTWRFATMCAPLLDGVPIRSTTGPRLLTRFADSTFWLAARGEGEVVDMLSALGPGDVLIDVGANIGLMSLVAVERGARVVALEPSPREFDLLVSNRALLADAARERMICINAAAGASEGLAEFRINEVGHSGGNSFGGRRADSDEVVSVPVLCLDDLDRHPDVAGEWFLEARDSGRLVLKVDVEGFEHSVLSGARRLLEEQRVSRAIVELNVARAASLGQEGDIGRFMGQFGYHGTIDPGGREHFDQCFVPTGIEASGLIQAGGQGPHRRPENGS